MNTSDLFIVSGAHLSTVKYTHLHSQHYNEDSDPGAFFVFAYSIYCLVQIDLDDDFFQARLLIIASSAGTNR